MQVLVPVQLVGGGPGDPGDVVQADALRRSRPRPGSRLCRRPVARTSSRSRSNPAAATMVPARRAAARGRPGGPARGGGRHRGLLVFVGRAADTPRGAGYALGIAQGSPRGPQVDGRDHWPCRWAGGLRDRRPACAGPAGGSRRSVRRRRARRRPGSGIPRRRLLSGCCWSAPALAGCALGAGARPARPVDRAGRRGPRGRRAGRGRDRRRPRAGRAGAAVVDARTAHAAALDAEVARLDRAAPPPAPAPAPPAPGRGPVPLARVEAAARSSADAAAALALDLPVDRVGLVASVAACCAAYATVLTGPAG